MLERAHRAGLICLSLARDTQKRHPDIHVEDDRIYIIDGSVWTSAGMTAGLDLALAMVEPGYENRSRQDWRQLVLR